MGYSLTSGSVPGSSGSGYNPNGGTPDNSPSGPRYSSLTPSAGGGYSSGYAPGASTGAPGSPGGGSGGYSNSGPFGENTSGTTYAPQLNSNSFNWGGQQGGASAAYAGLQNAASSVSGIGDYGGGQSAPQVSQTTVSNPYGDQGRGQFNSAYNSLGGVGGQYGKLADFYQGMVNGTAPSLAQAQLNTATNQNLNNQFALANAGHGGLGSAASYANAQNNAAQIGQGAAQQAVAANLQQQQLGAQGLSSALGGQAATYGQQAGLAGNQEQFNQNAAQYQAGLNQQTNLQNAQNQLSQTGLNNQFYLGAQGLANQIQNEQLQAQIAGSQLQSQNQLAAAQANQQNAQFNAGQNNNMFNSVVNGIGGLFQGAGSLLGFDMDLGGGRRYSDADLVEPNRAPQDMAHWTLREEKNFILAKNQRTGQMMKLATEPLSPEEHRQAMASHGAGPLGSEDPRRMHMTYNDMGFDSGGFAATDNPYAAGNPIASMAPQTAPNVLAQYQSPAVQAQNGNAPSMTMAQQMRTGLGLPAGGLSAFGLNPQGTSSLPLTVPQSGPAMQKSGGGGASSLMKLAPLLLMADMDLGGRPRRYSDAQLGFDPEASVLPPQIQAQIGVPPALAAIPAGSAAGGSIGSSGSGESAGVHETPVIPQGTPLDLGTIEVPPAEKPRVTFRSPQQAAEGTGAGAATLGLSGPVRVGPSVTPAIDPRLLAQKESAGAQAIQAAEDLGAAQQGQAEDTGIAHALKGAMLAKQAGETKARAEADDLEIRNREQAISDLSHDVATQKLDPENWWHSQSTGNQVRYGIATMFGAIGQALTHGGQNVALERIDGHINRDLEEQKRRIEAKKGQIGDMQGLLASAYRRTGNMAEAMKVAHGIALQQVDEEQQAFAANSNSAAAKAQADAHSAEIKDRVASDIAGSEKYNPGGLVGGTDLRQRWNKYVDETIGKGEKALPFNEWAQSVLGAGHEATKPLPGGKGASRLLREVPGQEANVANLKELQTLLSQTVLGSEDQGRAEFLARQLKANGVEVPQESGMVSRLFGAPAGATGAALKSEQNRLARTKAAIEGGVGEEEPEDVDSLVK